MKCKFCGCTDARACPGGCSWTRPGVCSQCADAAIRAYCPMPVRYLFDTNYRPRGLKLEKGIEGVTYKRDGLIDFLPSVGIEIDCCGDGDLRKVDGVYYFPRARRLEIYFEICGEGHDGRTHQRMLDSGWSLA